MAAEGSYARKCDFWNRKYLVNGLGLMLAATRGHNGQKRQTTDASVRY